MGEVMTPPSAISVFASCLLLMLVGANVQAKTYTAGPGDYMRTLRLLSPGDTLQLAPGYYRSGLRLDGLHGEDGAPITIAGPRDGPRSVLLGRPGHNTVSIKNAAYVTLRDLELDGRGAFVDAVKAEGNADYAHHITLENLHIHNYALEQQSVGISTKCPSWDWVVRGNRIEDVGTGMYFGNSNGRDPFIGGLIEGNTIANTIGYNLQIKHQRARPLIESLADGPRMTIIRRNRFIKAENASSGEAARPNVLVGHFPIEGPGSTDGYAIYANLFFQNPHEALFQGEGNIALYSNVFFNSHANDFPAIAIQPHNDIPRKVRVFFNTVVHPSIGIRVLRKEDLWVDDQTVIGNAVFADRPIKGGIQSGNFTASLSESQDHLRAPVDDLMVFSAVPRQGRLRADRVVSRLLGYPEAARDFAGNPRDGGRYGAYTSSVPIPAR
jgi:hypothetical protein